MTTLQALQYNRGSYLNVLDQTLLPFQTVYIELSSVQDIWDAIAQMKVRGAPAIALCAGLGLSGLIANSLNQFKTSQDLATWISHQLGFLETSRPTAVNLFQLTHLLKEGLKTQSNSESPTKLYHWFAQTVETYLEEDLKTNLSIGQWGQKALQSLLGNIPLNHLNLLTHCNTGSLATSGHGTALGIIRQCWNSHQVKHVYCTETRPYNQGARLTAYELVYEKIPSTLVCDSMVASLILNKGIHAILVGADRVCANGDTANKIGTFQLAVLAKHFGIPFIVAAPTTSIDMSLNHGNLIPIEERPAKELLEFQGKPYAAPGILAWNPGFDVTPHHLISAIVTERGFHLNSPTTGFGNLLSQGENSIEP